MRSLKEMMMMLWKRERGRPSRSDFTITMLKKFKQATLKSLKTAGVSSFVQRSRWRRQRLLILAYHGISLSDEHLWNGSQFISAEVFVADLNR